MSVPICLLLTSVVALAASPERFLEAAREEGSAGGTKSACLAAWASVAYLEPLPAGPLSAEEKAALQRAGGTRRLRLYGVLKEGELRVSWSDPLSVLGRVRVAATSTSGAAFFLETLGPAGANAIRFRVPSSVAGRLRIVGLAKECLPDETLIETHLLTDDEESLPAPPGFARPGTVGPRSSSVVDIPTGDEEEPQPFEWWWFAVLGLAAVALTLGAVEELR